MEIQVGDTCGPHGVFPQSHPAARRNETQVSQTIIQKSQPGERSAGANPTPAPEQGGERALTIAAQATGGADPVKPPPKATQFLLHLDAVGLVQGLDGPILALSQSRGCGGLLGLLGLPGFPGLCGAFSWLGGLGSQLLYLQLGKLHQDPLQ